MEREGNGDYLESNQRKRGYSYTGDEATAQMQKLIQELQEDLRLKPRHVWRSKSTAFKAKGAVQQRRWQLEEKIKIYQMA